MTNTEVLPLLQPVILPEGVLGGSVIPDTKSRQQMQEMQRGQAGLHF